MVKLRKSTKKSTGASARRMTLSPPPSRTRSSRILAKSASTTTAKTRSNTESYSITNSITFNIQPEVPTHVLTIDVRGEANTKADMYHDHDEWCTVCRNGGNFICCEECFRVVCFQCVEFPEDASVTLCPFCHLRSDSKEGKKRTPYKVDGRPLVLKSKSSTRETFPRCVSEPLAIVSITLQGFADNGPSRPTFEHVVPYLRGNACYANLDFNFGSDPEIESFSQRLKTLINAFKSGELQRFRRFFVFLTTHSDPEQGDLHIAPTRGNPGNRFTATAEEVFQHIFRQSSFGELLKKSLDSVLVLVSCGAVVLNAGPLESVLDLSTQKYFSQILAFTQPDLQPTFASKFFHDYVINRFIHLKDNIKSYIYDHQALGAHTDLLVVDSETNPTSGKREITGTFLFWSHNGQRPMGHACLQQCPSCFALKPWTPKEVNNKVEHKCKGCGIVVVYSPKPGSTKVTPPGGKDSSSERGTWWFKVSRR